MAKQVPPAGDKVVERIDAIMHELAELRRLVVAQQVRRPTEPSLTKQLYGSLGQGTWDEWHHDLDWQRFSE